MKIILVDGSALLYRSHFAFQRSGLQTRSGEVTNASFGFANALVKLRTEDQADVLVVAFDRKGPTFRHEMFPDYKANRSPMPEELAAQLPRVKELVESMQIPLVEQDGVEADDLLASLALEGIREGHEIWIYSGDKDFIPLVRPGLGILKPARKGEQDSYLRETDLKKDLGISPAGFRDALALMGDTSDNVPGIPGIGRKTALKLIRTFGSIDGLLENLDDHRISPRHRKLIREHHEQLMLSLELVTLKSDIPWPLDYKQIQQQPRFPESFLEFCRKMEFHRLLRRLENFNEDPVELEVETAPAADASRYRWIADLEELQAFLAEVATASQWSVDTETTSVDPHRAELVGISISVRPAEAVYIPVDVSMESSGPVDLFESSRPRRLPWEEVRQHLGPMLADPAIGKTGQNLKYDQIVLERHGAPLAGVVFDSMIASYLLAPQRRQHNLDALAAEVLSISTTSYKELFAGQSSKDIRDLPMDRLSHYACEDADMSLRLAQLFAEELQEAGLEPLMREVEIPLSQVLMRMEMRGIRLDIDFLKKLSGKWQKELTELTDRIHSLAGGTFNINSPKQLQQILFDKLGLKPVKKTATGFSTDVEVLSRLADEHALPASLLEYRQLQKLLSTYVDALPKLVHPQTGCLHTSFNQAVAATGRLSSSDPNLQNIPIRTERGRRIREAFVPRNAEHVLLSADYSQIELRLMAHFSGDETMGEAFRNSEDVHSRTAALVHGVDVTEVDADMRRRAKAINFGILYGMGARALGKDIGLSTKEAQGFIDQYFERFGGVREFIDRTIRDAEAQGEVRTLLGRRRPLPELASRDPRQKSMGQRMAVNTPIQGSAADLIKLAMIRLDERIRRESLKAEMLLQVHDELILEVPRSAVEQMGRVVREEMEGVMELKVPLVVDVHSGASWAEAHP